MVQEFLDDDSLPVATLKTAGQSSTLEQGIRFWFRDWNALGTYNMANATDPVVTGHKYLDKFRPIYTYGNNIAPPDIAKGAPNGVDEWSSEPRFRKRAYSDEDFDFTDNYGQVKITANKGIANAYENRKIPGHLRFQLKPGSRGVYEFIKMGSKADGFFPLTGGAGGTIYDANYDGSGVDRGGVEFCHEKSPCNRPTRLDDGANENWGSTSPNKKSYNLSFTMMMSYTFRMEEGLTFEFTGDDDVWLFINKRLVNQIDIGGIHSYVTDRVNLDDLRRMTGNPYKLEIGDKALFHFFYAERHSDDSNIKITTNIVNTIITGVDILVKGDTIRAGVPEPAFAVVNTLDEGRLTNFDKGKFTWKVTDIGPLKDGKAVAGQKITWTNNKGQNCDGTTNCSKSDSILVTAEKAYTFVEIYGEYYDSLSGKPNGKSVIVWVAPGAPTQVSVEGSDVRTTGNQWNVSKLDTIRIASTATEDNNFFAILRDKFGNWVGPAATGTTATTGRTIKWATSLTNIATADVFNAAGGRGKAVRVADAGQTPLSVTYTIPASGGVSAATLTGNSTVKVENVTYKGIQIGIKRNGVFVPLSSSADPNNPGTLDMISGTDTVLYVQLQRSDNNAWVEVPASWSSGGLTTATPPPTGTAISWLLQPRAPTPANTPGTVTVTVPAGTGTGSAKLNVKVVDMDPKAARFSIKSGEPSFDSTITVFRNEKSGKARMYAVPTSYVELVAGVRMPIVGQLFSNTSINATTWLSNVTGGKWTWAPVPGSPSITRPGEGISENPSLRSGDSITFMTTVAHNTYQIRGTFVKGNITITQDIWVRVIPDAYNAVMVLEGNNQGMTVSPNAAQRLGEVVFTESDEQKVVYAVIRDKYGNYICASGAQNPYPPPAGGGTTDWAARANIVTVEPGYALWGEGKINRGANADGRETFVTAKNSAWGSISDSVKVIFRGYDYDTIKIATKCKSGQSPSFTIGGVQYCKVVDTLKMTSNDDEQVFVFGKRNDCNDVKPGSGVTGSACWESIPGNWSSDPGLGVALGSPPSGTPSWTLVPEGPGRGQIVVTRPGTPMTDAIDVVITVGPPLRAELEITTPADQLIAGKDITGVIRYYNRAGLMTEWDQSWNPSKSALFADTLGTIQKNGKDVQPLVRTEVDQVLCYQGSGCRPDYINAVLPHNSTNLNDLAKFVIYLAADGHQIRYTETLNVGGTPITITAVSAKFTVLPGEPAAIKIEGPGVKNDTLKVNQGDPEQVLHAVAVDEWGNNIGDYPSNWVATTPISVDAKDRPVIVYVPSMAQDNGKGPLCINAVTASGRPLNSCITVDLTGVTARPISAITRDYDGCGYLDRIEMKFKRPIPFAGGGTATAVKPGKDKITVVNKDFSFDVDSVTVKLSDSTVTIWLRDVTPHTGSTQTGWTPVVNIFNGLFEEAGAQTVNTTDGAPPVIASAKLYFPKEGAGKISDNYIEVKFSEKIKSSDGASFGISKNQAIIDEKFLPEALFNIWAQGGQNLAKSARTRALSKKSGDPYDGKIFALQDDRLAGIKKTVYIDESTLWFFLENEKEISPPNDYINIRTVDQIRSPINPTRVRDITDNVPLANNRKVPITFGNAPDGNMKPVPNPASPDPNRKNGTTGESVSPGKIFASHDKTAKQEVSGDRDHPPIYGGVVFEVPVYVPNSGTVKCQLKVYDLAGNLVISGESSNAADGISETGYTKMYLYWNGYNSKKMKVAPGTYRMVVYISYNNLGKNDENAKNKKYQGIVGMSK
jgi:fibro-slime domain-containing protein